MNIGQLNRRVQILAFVEVRDEFGGIDGEWINIGTKWARIEQNGGSETTDNNQVKARLSTKIIMRYNPTLNEQNRIKYKDKLYEIKSVQDPESGHYMTIADCEELKESGLQCQTASF